jgi:transcriptional regulator with XRE-family HTH domain
MLGVMADLRKDFPKRLRFAREMRELTQAQLGRQAEIDQTVIAHFEAGSRLPGAENLRALAKGLMVSADYLLGLSERVS